MVVGEAALVLVLVTADTAHEERAVVAAAEDARREALNDFDPPKDVMTVL